MPSSPVNISIEPTNRYTSEPSSISLDSSNYQNYKFILIITLSPFLKFSLSIKKLAIRFDLSKNSLNEIFF